MKSEFYTNESEIKFIDKLKRNLDLCRSFCFSVSVPIKMSPAFTTSFNMMKYWLSFLKLRSLGWMSPRQSFQCLTVSCSLQISTFFALPCFPLSVAAFFGPTLHTSPPTRYITHIVNNSHQKQKNSLSVASKYAMINCSFIFPWLSAPSGFLA